jgi:hypothetical protein
MLSISDRIVHCTSTQRSISILGSSLSKMPFQIGHRNMSALGLANTPIPDQVAEYVNFQGQCLSTVPNSRSGSGTCQDRGAGHIRVRYSKDDHSISGSRTYQCQVKASKRRPFPDRAAEHINFRWSSTLAFAIHWSCRRLILLQEKGNLLTALQHIF